MKALRKTLIVKQADYQDISDKIIVPEHLKTKPFAGIVVEAGPMAVAEKGDMVIFSRFAAEEVQLDSEFYMFVDETMTDTIIKK